MRPEFFAFADGCQLSGKASFPRFDCGGVSPTAGGVRAPASIPPAGGREGGGPLGEFPSLSILVQLKRRSEKEGGKTAIVRKAETLFRNLQSMIERRGIEHAAFCTLTFKENLTDRVEAQRRFNSIATGFFREVEGLESITAVERQARGAIHYHMALALPWDVRSGFDFHALGMAQAAEKAKDKAGKRKWEAVYSKTATPELRQWWKDLRKAASEYGFGRCETIPIKTNAEGVARYIGSYVGKEFANREARDKGLRTLRYSLDKRPFASLWSYAQGGQAEWRKGCSVLGAILGTDDLSPVLGKRWAWFWKEQIGAFSRHHVECLFLLKQMVSDHWDTQTRLEKAASLASALLTWEDSEGRPGENEEARESRLWRKVGAPVPVPQEDGP